MIIRNGFIPITCTNRNKALEYAAELLDSLPVRGRTQQHHIRKLQGQLPQQQSVLSETGDTPHPRYITDPQHKRLAIALSAELIEERGEFGDELAPPATTSLSRAGVLLLEDLIQENPGLFS